MGFDERKKLSGIVEKYLEKIFDSEVEIVPFGVERLINNKYQLSYYLKSLSKINGKETAMMLEFIPDYILYKKSEPQNVFFLEVKCSVTPCWSISRVNRIKKQNGDENGYLYDESNIGEIAREPLMIYKRHYPNTIVIMAAPYNSKIIVSAQ